MTDPYFAADGTPDVEALAGLDRPSRMLAEWETRQDRLAAAKVGGDRAELQAAKLAVYNYRSWWRSVGEALGLRRVTGPAPEPVHVDTKVDD